MRKIYFLDIIRNTIIQYEIIHFLSSANIHRSFLIDFNISFISDPLFFYFLFMF